MIQDPRCVQIGFNGGNGTGFTELPYSARGYSRGLVTYGSANVAGRWLSRVDEEIVFGGCLNETTGIAVMVTLDNLRAQSAVSGKASLEIDTISMMGGHAVNVSGPCFRPTDLIRLQIEEFMVDCQRVRQAHWRCSIRMTRPLADKPCQSLLRFAAGCSFPIRVLSGWTLHQWWPDIPVVGSRFRR